MKNSELRLKLLKNFESYLDGQNELSEDNINIMLMLPAILELQNQKSLIYGRSYCKHGDTSIFFNVERKWDRVENIFSKALQTGVSKLYSKDSATPTETFVDTVVDLANYSILWASYIRTEHPEEWEKFLESNNLTDLDFDNI